MMAPGAPRRRDDHPSRQADANRDEPTDRVTAHLCVMTTFVARNAGR
jgi:hypothetical protein